jgi:hypothetical protein
MQILEGPWVEYAVSALLEEGVLRQFGYEYYDGTQAVLVYGGEGGDTGRKYDRDSFSTRHALRRRLRELLSEAGIPSEPGPRSTRQQRFEAEDLYLEQNDDAQPLVVRALGLAVAAYGHHEEIYIGPLLQKLNEISTPRGLSGSKQILERLKQERAASVLIRDGDDPTVVKLNDSHPAVRFLRTSLDKHVNQP